jgi:hypothetical protein
MSIFGAINNQMPQVFVDSPDATALYGLFYSSVSKDDRSWLTDHSTSVEQRPFSTNVITIRCFMTLLDDSTRKGLLKETVEGLQKKVKELQAEKDDVRASFLQNTLVVVRGRVGISTWMVADDLGEFDQELSPQRLERNMQHLIGRGSIPGADLSK